MIFLSIVLILLAMERMLKALDKKTSHWLCAGFEILRLNTILLSKYIHEIFYFSFRLC